MLESEKKQFLRDKLRRDYLLGKVDGVPRIPTSDELDAAVERALASSQNDLIGQFGEYRFRAKSDPGQYRQSVQTARDNVQVLMDRTAKEVNEIIDLVNDSTVEKNNAVRELKKISTSFKEIETGQLRDNQVSYSISDTLNDLEKVDQQKTTADVNLNAGAAVLNQTKAKRLQFPHYLGQRSITPVITLGQNTVQETEQMPGTTWGAVFSIDDTDRWEYMVKTDSIVPLESYVTVKLTADGSPVEINEMVMRLSSNHSADREDPNGFVRIEFRDLQDDQFKNIPGGSKEVFSDTLEFCFTIPETTHIRIHFHKEVPDDLETFQYFFGMTELVVRTAETAFESVLQTKSLQVESYRTEVPTIYSVMLDTEQTNMEGTRIKHFVALDDPIPGKVINGDGDVVDVDSEDAVSFVPNGTDAGGESENFYVYASRLQQRPDVSGAEIVSQWEPKWQEIAPVDEKATTVPNVVFFNNSQVREDVQDISFLDPIVWGDPRYTGPWPTTEAAADGFTWATDWDGSGTMPMSGFIWGENPFKFAGVWWGDGIEYPGWWRPRVPDASGGQTWYPTDNTETQKQSFPDYSVPVYDDGCKLVAVKQFWKIWKWPKEFVPIPGTTKLSISIPSDIQLTEKTLGHVFKENRPETVNVERNFTVSKTLKNGEYYVNVKLDELPSFDDRKDLAVLRESITAVEIKDFGGIDDFFTEFGVDYTLKYGGQDARANNLDLQTITAANNGVQPSITNDREASPSGDAHFTVLFAGALDSYSALTSNNEPTVDITFDFRYNTVDNMSWETYTFVRDDVEEGAAFININDPSGFIDKVTVNQLTDHGIIADTQEYTNVAEKINIPNGWVKVKIFTTVDLNTAGEPAKWNPSDKFTIDSETVNAFEQSTVVRNFSSNASMTQVDLYTLMHETDVDDDTRFAVIDDVDGAQFIVVKTPSSAIFPSGLVNGVRFTRTHFDPAVAGNFLTFTTGSSGNVAGHPQAVDLDGNVVVDTNIQNRPSNTVDSINYPNISTFGAEMQLTDPCGSGFLFWDTAENLEMFYNIEYKLPARNRPSNRILYKTKLVSNDANKTPVLSSYNLIINSKEDVRPID